MAVSPLKMLLLFLVGGVTAAGATAYVAGALDPWLKGEVPAATLADTSGDVKGGRVGSGETGQPAAPAAGGDAAADAAKPADESNGTEIAALTPPVAGGDDSPADAAPAVKDEPQKAADPNIPTFDVVRVEPDGSIVIAGKGPPKAYVEVLTSTAVVASASATDEGDFAAVPDERLKPGDYALVLRAIAPGNVVTISEETALISIPETVDGTVLAMVEKEGAASRIISLPAVTEPGKKETEVAAAPAGEKPADTAAAADATKPADAAPATGAATETPPATEPTQASGGQDVAVAETKPEGEDQAAGGAAAEATTPEKPAEAAPEVAAARPEATEVKPATEETKPAEPAIKVRVEAVEIDGRKVFVAGAADPGMPIRAYANDIVLGDTLSSTEGRFLVEATRDLPVGEYVIRADVLAADGKVLARAAVPFEREPGETIAAVAPPVPEPKPVDAPKEAVTSGQPKQPEPAKPAEETAKAETPAATAETKAPAATAGNGAPETDSATGAATTETGTATAAATDSMGKAAAGTAEKPPIVAAVEPPKSGASTTEPASGNDTAKAPAPAATESAAATAPSDAAATPPAAGESSATAAATAETLAPRLEASASGVIIRRGDTLWRISKRVYGRGMRYSTIYLANQGQIEDPDRIWPGQIFKVPEKTAEGEAADMKAVGEQATAVQ